MQTMLVSLCALIPQAMRMTPEEARRLGQSYLKKPLHRIIVRKKNGEGFWPVVEGSNRVHGLRMELGEKSDHPVECEVIEDDVSDEEVFLISAIRKEPTAQEQVRKVEKLAELHPGWQGKDFAAAVHLDPGHISRLRKVSKCLPVVREAFFAGRLTLIQVAEIGGLPDCEQHVLLAKVTVNGEKKERRARNGLDEPKVEKVKIRYEKGDVTVTGNGMDVASVREVLEGVVKELRRAEGTFDLGTVVRMQRDRHKGTP